MTEERMDLKGKIDKRSVVILLEGMRWAMGLLESHRAECEKLGLSEKFDEKFGSRYRHTKSIIEDLEAAL